MRIRWYSCVQVDKITFIRGNTDPALCCGSNAAYCLSSCSKVLAEALAIAYWSFTHAANQTLIDDRGRHCSLRYNSAPCTQGVECHISVTQSIHPRVTAVAQPLGNPIS